MVKLVALLLAIVVAGAAYAGPITIPNTFVNGTAADADEVNANFSAVEVGVDGNASDIDTLQAVGADNVQVNTLTFGDGAGASIAHTYDISGTDAILTVSSGGGIWVGDFSASGTLTADNLDFGAINNVAQLDGNLCTDGQILKNSGGVSWTCAADAAGSAVPAGSNTQVQYNDNGAWGAEAAFNYNASTDTLTVGSLVTTGGSDGTYGQVFDDNTSTMDSGGTGECKLGFVAGVLNKHCDGGSLTSLEGGSGDVIEVSSGNTVAINPGSITANSCDTSQTTTATGAATTDVVSWSFAQAVGSTVGYQPLATGGVSVSPYVSASNTITWEICNWTDSALDPASVNVNWRIDR